MKKFALLFSFCSLLIVACDLFIGPKVDLFQQINGEIDWANAKKLTVRIEYPPAWGTSNPVQGDITPAMDIRKGYEFSVDFKPDIGYTLDSWRAYFSDDLNKLPGNWLDFTDLLDGLETFGPDDGVTFPTVDESNEAGGTFKFKINTAEPVTLIPWCDSQTKITRTEPRDVGLSGKFVSRTSDIALYFNGALNRDTIKFANAENADGIWITAESLDDGAKTNNQNKKWYSDPVYSTAGGFFTVTMKCRDTAPEDSLMTVTVKGIENRLGKEMDGVYSFSWKTPEQANVSLNSYSAVYMYDTDEIAVSLEQTGADKVVIYYRQNSEDNSLLTTIDNIDDTIAFSNTVGIKRVPRIDDSGVREGRRTSGINEYEIFIELYSQDIMVSRTPFKIWNIPDMVVSNDKPAYEVINATDALNTATRTVGLANLALNDPTKQYVLANDITISTAWTPIGNDSNPFKGKFYGNGRTITFTGSSSIGGTNYRGLFGYADGALIRDLTFEYNASSAINVSTGDTGYFDTSINYHGVYYNIGGVVGYLKDTAVRNVITSGGTININGQVGNEIIRFGGITGYIEGSGKIENCRATLSTAYTSNGHVGGIYIGAVAGETGTGDTDNTLSEFNNGLIASPNSLSGLLIDGVTIFTSVSAKGSSSGSHFDTGYICIGGAVGQSGQNTMNDIKFIAGTVSFSGDYNFFKYCGGIVGNLGQANIVGSSFAGTIETNGTVDGKIYIGGLAGYVFILNDGENFIHGCRVEQTDIKLSGGIERVVGGILGGTRIYPDKNVTITITNTNFNGGNIILEGNATEIKVGGFLGISYGGSYNIENCGVLSGTIKIDLKADYFIVGGFIGKNDYGFGKLPSNISKSFSMMDIITKGSSASGCIVGGFISEMSEGDTIEGCYAAGNIISTIDGDVPAFVGGLVGLNRGTIKNCYALGNVVVDKSIEDSLYYNYIIAGGLVGRNYYGNIFNCFGAGQVSAQSVSTEVYSGGIVGMHSLFEGNVNNTAALGASVTVSGIPARRYVGRIYGNNGGTSADNYALNSMAVEEGAYNDPNPSTRDADSGTTTRDGESAASSTFLRKSFWTDTLGFDSTVWDFSRVAMYPRLAWEK